LLIEFILKLEVNIKQMSSSSTTPSICICEHSGKEQSVLSLFLQAVEMLTLSGGLYCVGFINPIGIVAGVHRERLALSTGPI
jgi:hypothetical protein